MYRGRSDLVVFVLLARGSSCWSNPKCVRGPGFCPELNMRGSASLWWAGLCPLGVVSVDCSCGRQALLRELPIAKQRELEPIHSQVLS